MFFLVKKKWIRKTKSRKTKSRLKRPFVAYKLTFINILTARKSGTKFPFVNCASYQSPSAKKNFFCKNWQILTLRAFKEPFVTYPDKYLRKSLFTFLVSQEEYSFEAHLGNHIHTTASTTNLTPPSWSFYSIFLAEFVCLFLASQSHEF